MSCWRVCKGNTFRCCCLCRWLRGWWRHWCRFPNCKACQSGWCIHFSKQSGSFHLLLASRNTLLAQKTVLKIMWTCQMLMSAFTCEQKSVSWCDDGYAKKQILHRSSHNQVRMLCLPSRNLCWGAPNNKCHLEHRTLYSADCGITSKCFVVLIIWKTCLL